MKILFLTRDYTKRTDAYTLYLPFHDELRKNGVDVVGVDAFKLYGDSYEPDILKGKIIEQNQLDVDFINDTYDIIVGENFFPYFYEQWDKIKVKKVIWLGDIWGYVPKWLKMVKERIGIDAIFTHYLDSFEKNYDEMNVYHLPHSISLDVHKDYNLNKDYRSLLIGAIGESVYPLRWKIWEEMKEVSSFKRIERPSNRMDRDKNIHPYGSEYCKEINRSQMAYTCTGIFECTFAKLFEIPACNTALVSNYIPEMGKLGFIPNENFIEIDMNTNIREFTSNLDDDYVKQITKNGYEFITKKHTTEIRCKEFLKYCGDIIN